MLTLDVVIPTGKNIVESNYSICYTIRSILSQSLLPQKIIVVENVLNTGIREVLPPLFGNYVDIVDGTKKSPNIAYARNIGSKLCKSDLIVFLDDDVVLGYHNYFARILEIMKSCDFCCGATRLWTLPDWNQYLSLDYSMFHILQVLKAKSYIPQSIERTSGCKNFSEYTYIGNFGAVRRQVYDNIGGFDEEYEGWLYQDTDLMMRLCYSNYRFEVLSYTGIYCFHLSHPADKQRYRAANKRRYDVKQLELGIRFNISSFFGRFDNNDYNVITDLQT